MYNAEYHMWGMHIFWWLFWLVLFLAFFGWFEPVPRKKRKKQSGLEILQMRFAKGEITKEEYEERKAILERDKETPVQADNHEQV
jgi:putative membrane protein